MAYIIGIDVSTTGTKVLVIHEQGQVVATFGLYGFDSLSFSLPAGIDVDGEGYVYVADTDGHRVLKFPPIGPQ